MCGRFALTDAPEEIAALFGYLDAEDFPPRYNIAPTQPIAVVRIMHGKRRFALVRWGLIPSFVTDPKKFGLLINARADSITTRGAVKHAMRYRRCLVPASGFYEWRQMPGSNSGKTRQPFWLHARDGKPIALAGLWETWADRTSGSEIDSACIITTEPNRVVASIHDRMPAIIGPQDFDTWLTGDAADAAALLRPAPDDLLESVAISTRVNSAANDDPAVLEPAAPTLL